MNSPIGWPGGKRSLVKRLLQLVPQHRIYVEPFCGSAKLLFAKAPSKVEVINDLHADLHNFMLVLKHRPAALAETVRRIHTSPHEFKRLKSRSAAFEDEVDWAARFWFLNAFSFGAKGQNFGWPTKDGPRLKSHDMRALFHRAAKRLDAVAIDSRDAIECIERYDSAETFIYCDPPYERFSLNGRYRAGGHYQRIVALAPTLKGKLLLSYSYSDDARRAAREAGLHTRCVTVTYTLGGFGRKKCVKELLCANYPMGRA